MGFLSNAKDNYEKRQQIAEWNYRAREYISEGQQLYEQAYGDLAYACSKTESKINKDVSSIVSSISYAVSKFSYSNIFSFAYFLALCLENIDISASLDHLNEELIAPGSVLVN